MTHNEMLLLSLLPSVVMFVLFLIAYEAFKMSEERVFVLKEQNLAFRELIDKHTVVDTSFDSVEEYVLANWAFAWLMEEFDSDSNL